MIADLTADAGPCTVEVRGVGKTYGRRHPVRALEPVDLRLRADEFTSVVGPSGCGKSTLLHVIAGLEAASEGEVLVDGRPTAGPGRDRGMVFQNYTLFPWLTVRRNVEFALRDLPMSRRERRERADEYLALVGVEAFAEARSDQLSGGMRQRVAIARALCYQPRVLLMDEPFGALDAQTRQEMQELLTTVWEQHRMTVVFVTHDIEEAIYLSDRVVVMTARPGTIKEDVRIDLPRPRTVEMVTEEPFAHHKARLLASIREESARSRAALRDPHPAD